MVRVNFIVEGPTEETFVNDILTKYLSPKGIYPKARSIETSRRGAKIYRGGMTNYSKAKKDILQWLAQDPEAYVTTMFDFYALPKNFPDMDQIQSLSDPTDKVIKLEEDLEQDIGSEKFIAYIQLHEFEALLFSDANQLDDCMSLYQENGQAEELNRILEEFENPECINNSPKTAPSKRLKNLYPSYDKVFLGSLISGEIGLETIKTQCNHFNRWIEKLEGLIGD